MVDSKKRKIPFEAFLGWVGIAPFNFFFKVQTVAKSSEISSFHNSEELSKSLQGFGCFFKICFLLFFKSHKHWRTWAVWKEVEEHLTEQAPDEPGMPNSGWVGNPDAGLLFHTGSFPTCPIPTEVLVKSINSKDKHIIQNQNLLRKHGLV